MKIYKVGILGCNRVAEHYKFLLTEYKEIDALDIVACCDLQENFASSLAKSFSGNAYTDLDFMLNNEELDFVLVLTLVGCTMNIVTRFYQTRFPLLLKNLFV